MGSPPRIRGKHLKAKRIKGGIRITPAYTGKTCGVPLDVGAYGDHPRVYGENLRTVQWNLPQVGSPPRIRGKLAERRVLPHQVGITPAYTGKTCPIYPNEREYIGSPPRIRGKPSLTTIAVVLSGDHPRVYGENMYSVPAFCRITGSPPRIRGKLYGPVGKQCHGRITPAYTGKTRTIRKL